VELIAQSTARLIVNRASLKMKHEQVTDLITRLKAELTRRSASRRKAVGVGR